MFVCNVDGNHIQEIRWLKNEGEVQPQPDRIELKSHKLIIRRLNASDNGSYRCLARNKVGTIQSNLYRFEIDHGATRSAAFRCDHSSHKNTVSEALLCRGKRSGGVKRDADIITADAMKKGDRKRLSVNENQKAILSCDVKSVDRSGSVVFVKWRRDGKIFRQTKLDGPSSDVADSNLMDNPLQRGDERIVVNNKNGSLIILSTVPSDAGIYECYVHKNAEAPTTMQTTELKIIEELRFSPKPTAKQLELGSVGKLHCKVQGTPTPQVHWIKVAASFLSLSFRPIFLIRFDSFAGVARRVAGAGHRHQRNVAV